LRCKVLGHFGVSFFSGVRYSDSSPVFSSISASLSNCATEVRPQVPIKEGTMKKIILAGLGGVLAVSCSAVFAVGAIAVDDQRGSNDPGYGFYIGASSRSEAERGAMRECRKSGNDRCKVMVWFETCGAYASSRKYYGVGWGANRRDANRMALDNCGHDRCRIAVSRCE
jgi:hypothetical protein